jgi:DNA-binding response OmpR family regulator
MTRPIGPKILVAEDDETMRELVSRWLLAAGYEVVKASNGEEVIEVVRDEAPAAIVMDLTMPRMDGFQVLAKFRVLGLPLAPVLLLTGRHSADDVRKAVSLGAKDYLAKPVERDHLLARLERMLSKAAPPPPAPAEKKAGHYLD